MKQHITRKLLKQYYPNRVFYVHGNAEQCFLRLKDFLDIPYYNAGVYGWNFDVYTIGGYAFVMGYRGMFGREDIPKKVIELLKKASEYQNRDWKKVISYKRAMLTRVKNYLYGFED